MPTVGVIAPINADSNVESAVGINPQSALDKEVSGDNLVSDDKLAGVCTPLFS